MNGAIHAGTFAPRRLRIFHQDTDGWWVERSKTRPDDSINGDDGNLISDTPAQGDDPLAKPVPGRLEMNEMSNFHVIDLNPRSLKKGAMY